jgi:hypothetical protein
MSTADNRFGRNFLDIASGELATAAATQTERSISTGVESDFVWAVRATKIWKGGLDRTWSMRTQSKGATLSLGDEDIREEEIAQELEAEGVGNAEKVWLSVQDGFLVL